MKRKTSLKIAAALLASSIIATPISAALAGHDRHHGPAMFDDGFMGGDFERHGDKHDKHEKHGKDENRARVAPLSVDEARILVEAMLVRSQAPDLKVGDALMAEEPGKIDVLLTSPSGDLVKVIKFDAKTGQMDRKARKSLHKLLPRPDHARHLDRSYSTEEMNILVKAMVINSGKGALKLDKLVETDRGTYLATVTNQKGDIVREMELSSVTGRPVR